MTLPDRIFFTGVPGSRWSGIAQYLEQVPGFNTSDHTPIRDYSHHSFSGHKGAYFGREMEFEAILDSAYIDQGWNKHRGTKLVKSHDWAFQLNDIREQFPEDWIMLVYRSDMTSYAWWHEAGGFQIAYPSYTAYKNSTTMLAEIMEQNRCILEFAHKHKSQWNYFTTEWVEQIFGHSIEINMPATDILVTVIR